MSLSPWAQERADGFAEALADFGVLITVPPGAGGTHYGVLLVQNPIAGLDATLVGMQQTDEVTFLISRTDLVAAELRQETTLALANNPRATLRVTAIGDDGTGEPTVRVMAERLR